MTIYDEPGASDGKGGPHPLAGISQATLDAATKTLEESGIIDGYYASEVEPVAHAVLLAALQEMGRQPERGDGEIVVSVTRDPLGRPATLLQLPYGFSLIHRPQDVVNVADALLDTAKELEDAISREEA